MSLSTEAVGDRSLNRALAPTTLCLIQAALAGSAQTVRPSEGC
jgi:hypothetical protein